MYKLAAFVLLWAMSMSGHRRNDSDCDLRPRAMKDNLNVFKLRGRASRDPGRDIYLLDAADWDGLSGTAPHLGCKLWVLKVAANFAFTPCSTVGGLRKSSGDSPVSAHTGHFAPEQVLDGHLCVSADNGQIFSFSTLSSRGCCGYTIRHCVWEPKNKAFPTGSMAAVQPDVCRKSKVPCPGWWACLSTDNIPREGTSFWALSALQWEQEQTKSVLDTQQHCPEFPSLRGVEGWWGVTTRRHHTAPSPGRAPWSSCAFLLTIALGIQFLTTTLRLYFVSEKQWALFILKHFSSGGLCFPLYPKAGGCQLSPLPPVYYDPLASAGIVDYVAFWISWLPWIIGQKGCQHFDFNYNCYN